METTLEKAGNIATKTMENITKSQDKPGKAETKGAASDEGKEKTEGTKVADVEAKAKEDERILGADEKDLSDADKTRKIELLDLKKKKDDSPDEKIKRVQESSQKRIDEIVSELKDERNKRTQDQETIKRLEAEMAEVKKTLQPKVAEDEKTRIRTLEAQRINKYIEEDKNKPHEDRREMSKDDLDAWYLEDPVAATEWIQERTLRRVDERKAQKEESPEAKGKKFADDYMVKQNENLSKLFAKYPGVNPSKDELAKYAGKTGKELDAALRQDNEQYRICVEIVESDPKKYLESVDGPLQVMAEMEKRLAKKSEEKGSKKITLTEEELQAKLDAARQQEADRIAGLDEGISSTKGKKVESEKTKSQLRQKQEAAARKAGITVAQLDKQIERRRSIPGASQFTVDGEE